MKKLLLLLAVSISGYAQAQTPLYYGTHDANEIYVLDTTGGAYALSSTITVVDDQGASAGGVFGLSLHPSTEVMYILHGAGGSSSGDDRTLGTIDLTTGVVTDIGVAFNATDICFVGSTMYASLGNGSGYGVVIVDITDGTTTPFTNGDFSYGHSLAWNYFNGTLFRTDDSYGTFYEIDPNTGAVTDLAPSSYPSGNDYMTSSVFKNDSIVLISDGDLFEHNLNTDVSTQVYVGPNYGHALAYGEAPLFAVFNGEQCSNEAMLSVNKPGTAYQWYENSVIMAGETNAVLYPTFSGSPTVTNTYYCDVDGTLTPETVVTMLWAPTASFTATPTTVDLGLDPSGLVTFTNTSTGGNMYSWDFSGGFFSTNENPSFSFLTVGDTDVEFIVSKPNGCSDTAWTTVTVINTTSVTEFSSNFELYPNPVVDVLNITMQNGGNNYMIKVMDLSGRIIESRQVGNATAINVDMSNYVTGFYLVNISNGAEEQNYKILKK